METNSLRSYALSRLITSSEVFPNQKINKSNVQNLVDGFHKLNHNEKLLFLINIQQGPQVSTPPTLTSNNNGKQSPQTTSSSSNNNYPDTNRLTSTEKWLLENFTSDSQTALPKEEVYDFYIKTFKCKPISTADFGKLMRQVFPEVKARRLGQRGASKYCYANIRKKSEYDLQVPKIISNKIDTNLQFLQWGKSNFGADFENMSQLLCYLKSNKSAHRKRRNSSRKSLLTSEDPEIKKYLSEDNNAMPQLRNLLSENTNKKRHCSTIETKTVVTVTGDEFRSASVPIFDRYDLTSDLNNRSCFSADSGYDTTHPNTPVFNPLLSSVNHDNNLFDSVFDLIVESNHSEEFFDY